MKGNENKTHHAPVVQKKNKLKYSLNPVLDVFSDALLRAAGDWFCHGTGYPYLGVTRYRTDEREGISRERVHQSEVRAMRRLRNSHIKHKLQGYLKA